MFGIGYLLLGVALLWAAGFVAAVLRHATSRFKTSLREGIAKAREERS